MLFLGRLLVREGLLCENTSSFSHGTGKWKHIPMSTTAITRLGEQFLEGDDICNHIKLVPTPEMIQIYKKKAKPVIPKLGEWQPVRKPQIQTLNISRSNGPSNSILETSVLTESSQFQDTDSESQEILQRKIYDELVALRMKLASAMNCMPYMIANNKTLLDLAKLKPTNKKDLLNVEGFGEAKIQRFGDAIVEKIRELCGVSTSDSVNSQQDSKKDKEEQEVKPIEAVAGPSDASTLLEADDLWGDEDDSFLEKIELDKSVLNKEKTKGTSNYGDDIWDNEVDDSFNETLLDVEETLALSEDLCVISNSNVQKDTKPSLEMRGWVTTNKNSIANKNLKVKENENWDYSERKESGDTTDDEIVAGINWEAVEFENRTLDCKRDCNKWKTLESNTGWQAHNVKPGDSESDELQTANKRKLPEWLTKTVSKKEVKRRMKMNSLFK